MSHGSHFYPRLSHGLNPSQLTPRYALPLSGEGQIGSPPNKGELEGVLVLMDYLGLLHHTPLRKRQASRPRHNEVIQHAHIHQRQCLFQCIGQQVVGLAGFGDT